MKILLLQPPLRDFYATIHRTNALGLHLAAQLLNGAGHRAEVINFPIHGKAGTAPLPAELRHLEPYLISGEKGPVRGFGQFHHFGPPVADACRMVEEQSPDLVIPGLFAWAFGEDLLLFAREYRRRNGRAALGIAGAGFSAAPGRFVASGLFDLFFQGEAERLIPLWLDAGSPLEGYFVSPPTEGQAPGPVALVAPLSPGGSSRALSLSAGRGCPGSCRFCANYLVHGRGLRLPDIGVVMGEVERALNQSGSVPGNIHHIFLEDDNPSADLPWFQELLTRLHRFFPDAEISAENGIDYRYLSRELLPFLQERGFRQLNLSLASAGKQSLRRMGREGSRDHFREIAEGWDALGGRVISYFIAGLPGDGKEDMVDTLLYLSSLPGRAGVSLYYPLPDQDPEEPFRRYLGSAAWPWAGTFSTASLLTIFRLSRYINMMKDERFRELSELLVLRCREDGALYTLIGREKNFREIFWSDRDLVREFFSRVQAVS